MKKLFFYYQRSMFYVQQFGSEVGKPLRFLTEFGILILLLSNAGFKLSICHQLGIYLLLLLTAVFGGYFFVKIGVLKYVNSLNNQENKELMEIKNDIKQIRDKI